MQGYYSCHSETDRRNLNLSDWNKKNPMFKQYQIWILTRSLLPVLDGYYYISRL